MEVDQEGLSACTLGYLHASPHPSVNKPQTGYPSPVFQEGASATPHQTENHQLAPEGCLFNAVQEGVPHSMANQKGLEAPPNIMEAAMIEAGIPTITVSSAPTQSVVRPSLVSSLWAVLTLP